MTRILLFGDQAGTGFGTVTRDLGTALLARGEDVRFVSINEDDKPPTEEIGRRTFQVGVRDGYLAIPTNADEAVAFMARLDGLINGATWPTHPLGEWKPEAVIVLGDFYAVRRMPQMFPSVKDVPSFHYVPIEGVDIPPSWGEFWQIVHPVAMSKFGAEEIKRATGIEAPVVYHGVDTSAFWKVSAARPIRLGDAVLRSRDDCKRYFGGDPRATWLFRADRHMPRKRYASLLRAIAPVLARHRDLFFLYHCRTHDQGGNLDDTLSKYPPAIRAHCLSTRFHDQYDGAPREMLNALYNAADIYVTVSAEGFGLTIAEALACGVPAVGPRYSSVPEVIGPAGLTVPEGQLLDNEYDHMWWAVNERAYGQAVERLVSDVAERRLLGAKGPYHVEQNFRWDVAAERFAAIIEKAVRREAAA
jgi:glycosyltransferase involved in cell wall biosynthesis